MKYIYINCKPFMYKPQFDVTLAILNSVSLQSLQNPPAEPRYEKPKLLLLFAWFIHSSKEHDLQSLGWPQIIP